MTSPIWSVQRRPHQSLLVWAGFLGVCAWIFSIVLIPLMVEPSLFWYLSATAIGGFLCSAIVGSVWRGSRCWVDATQICHFGFTQRTNVSFPLAQVRHCAYVQRGLLRGIAVDIDIDAITVHHTKGINRQTLRAQQAKMGCPLVLEFLTTDDLATLIQLLEQTTSHPCTID